MKKFIVLTLVAVLCVTAAQAGLVGVGPVIADQYPDIVFDNIGAINYTASDDQFVLSAIDLTIAYSPTEYYSIFGVDMAMSLTVDGNGEIVGTGTMTEIVGDSSVTIKGETYTTGTTLLAGTVYAFGWADAATPGTGYWDFDFLVDNVTGALIDDALWPGNVDIGVTATAEQLNGWSGTWDSDFGLNKVKGDKAPVPEPATMALMALGGLLLRRKK